MVGEPKEKRLGAKERRRKDKELRSRKASEAV